MISNMSPCGEYNCSAPSRILKSQNVEILLVSGIGGRPLMPLAENKIKVFAGAAGKSRKFNVERTDLYSAHKKIDFEFTANLRHCLNR